MKTTIEEWRPVVGWEGLYEVRSTGEIRSLDRVTYGKNKSTRVVRGRELTPWLVDGYPRVALTRDGKPKQVHVHRILAEAFIPNPYNLPVVRHLNDIRDDNRIENLSWGSVSDNVRDAVRNGNNWKANLSECLRGHPFSEDNTRIDRDGCRQCRQCDRIRKRNNYHKNKKLKGRMK